MNWPSGLNEASRETAPDEWRIGCLRTLLPVKESSTEMRPSTTPRISFPSRLNLRQENDDSVRPSCSTSKVEKGPLSKFLRHRHGGDREDALADVAPKVPKTDRLVEAGRHEEVRPWRDAQRRHAVSVATEISQETVVMKRQIPDGVVGSLVRGIDDGAWVVRENYAPDAILFALYCLQAEPCLRVVHMNRVVITRCN
eukprot:CAMPEP_0177623288 /NCGR_PEP_ID=MMETSP0419_2-20121207/28823_1 /TAXON_ID=582737 /ORGANISM="Tetraselmis sp., Strain GSL018" /LENGTH=197 /DNA_ID=CAMNT_0019123831 /DNA_START=492 /DNA_END=1085 /DNA_ORIENTATION=-